MKEILTGCVLFHEHASSALARLALAKVQLSHWCKHHASIFLLALKSFTLAQYAGGKFKTELFFKLIPIFIFCFIFCLATLVTIDQEMSTSSVITNQQSSASWTAITVLHPFEATGNAVALSDSSGSVTKHCQVFFMMMRGIMVMMTRIMMIMIRLW